MDLETKINLLPDAYDKSVDSNITKIFEVITEVFQEIVDTNLELRGIHDINNVYGYTLDLLGSNYGITRDGMTDGQLRGLIIAKRFNFVSGNNVDKILNYFNFFASDVHLVEMFEPELGYLLDATLDLDGSWLLSGAGNRRYRAFDVQSAQLTIELETALRIALDFLKAAGIRATINLTTSYPDYGQYNYGQGFYGE